MIEIALNGFFIGQPYRIGAGGAVLRTHDEEVARVAQSFGAGDLATWSAAEIATLTLALERARADKWHGEEVLVRTGLANLSNILSGQLSKTPADARPWIERLTAVAGEFAGIRAITSPSWVTVQAQDLALRAALERAIRTRTDNVPSHTPPGTAPGGVA